MGIAVNNSKKDMFLKIQLDQKGKVSLKDFKPSTDWGATQ